jgi:3-oxoacyl-[acyl-carrier protein] reductase
MSEPRFAGRVAIVTGGARGIGATIAAHLAAEGAVVVAPDLIAPHAPLDGVAYLVCDVTDRAAVERTVGSIERDHGRLDLLVNNAGIQRIGLTDRIDPDEWSKVVDVHLNGAFHWSSLALRAMRPRRAGAIVTVASVAGILGIPGRGPYAAAKAALMSLTRVMAVEVAELGIRVNAVAPGMARTALVEQGIADGSILLDRMLDEIPMRRLATTDEIARAVLFLASDDAAYVTGQTLVVDGGWTIQGMRHRPDWLRGD